MLSRVSGDGSSNRHHLGELLGGDRAGSSTSPTVLPLLLVTSPAIASAYSSHLVELVEMSSTVAFAAQNAGQRKQRQLVDLVGDEHRGRLVEGEAILAPR